MWPTSNGSDLAQMPSAERKSGIPDSVLTPAPVRTTHGRRRSNSSASLATLTHQRYASPLVGKGACEQQEPEGEERPDAPDRLELREVDQEHLAHREGEDAEPTEPQR